MQHSSHGKCFSSTALVIVFVLVCVKEGSRYDSSYAPREMRQER